MATGRRRNRAMIYILLILILVIAAIGGVYYLNQPPKQPTVTAGVNIANTPVPTPQEVVDIVVTTQDLRRGQELKDELLALVAIPRKDFTEGVFYKDKKELLGARAKYDLKAHTPLTTALVFPVGATGSVPAFEIPAGKVAISVPISKLSSVAYGLQKGDHVNIIASLLMVDLDTNFQSKLPNRTGMVIAPGPIKDNQTYVTALVRGPQGWDSNGGEALSYLGRIEIDPTMNNPVYLIPSEEQRPRLVSQTLIQDVVILQLGDFSQGLTKEESLTAPAAAAQAGPTPTRAPQTSQRAQATETPAVVVPDVVTLIVSPQDAVTINYLMLAGANLNLVLRGAGDTDIKTTEAVTLQFILDQYQIPNPAKLPYGLEPKLEVFPGSVKPFPEPGAAPTATPNPK